ncbi:MAG: tetratricopeptide repeat protein [Gemmatimonadota bacterium]
MTSDPLAKEIQQFEQQVRRDPEGRVFARLADAYRKDGQLERALEVLEGGLTRHADYLSAHLVHARTLRSMGRPAEAIGAFEKVAELDSANVIALRALAELAEEAGQPDEALTHIESLLQILPQDEDLEQEAERLRRDAGGRQADPQTESAVQQREPDYPWLAPDADSETVAEEEFGAPSETTEPEPDEAIEANSDEPWLVLDDGSLDGSLEEFADGGDEAESTDAESGGQDFLLSLDSLMSESGAEGEELSSTEGADGEEQDDWRSSLSLIEDELDEIVLPELEPAETPGDSSVNPLEGWLVDDAAVEEPDETEDVPGDGDLLTRTMADLYADQGQPERAAEIYAELLKDLPEDERLQAALQETQSKMRDVPSEYSENTQASVEPKAPVEELSGTSEFFQEWLRSLED